MAYPTLDEIKSVAKDVFFDAQSPENKQVFEQYKKGTLPVERIPYPKEEKSVLEEFINNIKSALKEESIRLRKDFVGEATDLGNSILEGIKSGFKKLGANLSYFTSKAIGLGKLLPDIIISDKDIEIIQAPFEKSATEIFKKEAEQKKKAFEKKSRVSKFIYDTAEFFAPSIVPTPVGNPLLRAGLSFVKDTQLLYNPAEHDFKDDLTKRVSYAGEMFVSGITFHLVGKAISSVTNKLKEAVTTPMKNAFEAVSSNFNKKILTESNVSQALIGITRQGEETISVKSKDIYEVLSGKKAIDSSVREFFASPEWREVIKKYGADFKKYPEIVSITVKKTSPLESLITPSDNVAFAPKGLLPENTLFKTLEETFLKEAQRLASSPKLYDDLYNRKLPIVELDKVVSQLEKMGYKVNREKILDGLANMVKNIREIEDYQMAVLDYEMKQNLLNQIGGYEKSLKSYYRIYNLLKNKVDDITKIGEAYNKYAKKNNLLQLDEIAEDLRNRGFNIPVGEFEEGVLDIAMKLVEKEKLPRPPVEFDYKTVILDAIKPDVKQVEAPTHIALSEFLNLNKFNQFQKTVAAGDTKEAKKLVSEVSDNKMVQRTLKEVLGVVENKPIEKEEAEAIFGKTQINFQEEIQNWYRALQDKNVPPHVAIEHFNNLLKQEIKDTIDLRNIFKDEPTNRLTQGASMILDFFTHTQGYSSVFNSNQMRKVAVAINKWHYLNENLSETVNKFVSFIETNDFFKKRVRDIDEVIRKDGALILNPAYVNDKFTTKELILLRDYVLSYKKILETINILRTASGKNPIPEFDKYVAPHLLQKPILEALLEKEKTITEDVRFWFKRQLEDIGLGGIFSDDLVEVWKSYARVTKRLTSRYIYDFLFQQTGLSGSKLDYAAEAVLNRWREAAGILPKDRVLKSAGSVVKGLYEVVEAFGEMVKNKFNVGVKTFKLSDETIAQLSQSEKLRELFAEEIKNGYIKYDKNLIKFVDNLGITPKSIFYTLTLGWNTIFTLLNTLQPMATTLPFLGFRNTLKGYIDTIGTDLASFFGLSKNLDKFKALAFYYSLTGKGQTIFANEISLINPFIKLLTLNITFSEEYLIRPASFNAMLNYLKGAPISNDLKERIGIEFSKEVNYISGRVYQMPLGKIPIANQFVVFTQYANNAIGNLFKATKVAWSDKEAVKFFQELAIKAKASPEELMILTDYILKSKDYNLYSKVSRTIPILFSVAGLSTVGYTIGKLIFDAGSFISTQLGLSSPPTDKEEYEKTKEAFALSLSEKTSVSSNVGNLPYVTVAKALFDVAQGKTPQINAWGVDYMYAGLKLMLGSMEATSYVLKGDVDKATIILEDLTNEVLNKVNFLFVNRLKDAYDVYKKGVAMSKTRGGRVQYEAYEGENPLSVLFGGRGLMRGYRELRIAKEEVSKATDLRNQAWDLYERYLESGDERYYNLFKEKADELYNKTGEYLSISDMIRRYKQYRKGLTSVERTIKTQPKETKREILRKIEEKTGTFDIRKLLGL